MKEPLSRRKVLALTLIVFVIVGFIGFCVFYWILHKSLKASLIITITAFVVGITAEYIAIKKRKNSN